MFDIKEFADHIERCKELVKSRDNRGYARYSCGEMFKHCHGGIPFEYAEQRADVLVHIFPDGRCVLVRNLIGADLSSLNLEEQDEHDPHAEEPTHPILWWQKQADEQRAIQEDIRNLHNSIRFWRGI